MAVSSSVDSHSMRAMRSARLCGREMSKAKAGYERLFTGAEIGAKAVAARHEREDTHQDMRAGRLRSA